MIDRETVTWAYRLFLGREPENEIVINDKLAHGTIADLRRAFLASVEFQRANVSGKTATMSGHESQLNVETAASDCELRTMYAHLEAVWEKLGQEEPFWSVITSDRFLSKNLKLADGFVHSTFRPVSWL
ncbi:MAG: hypothetical protein H0X66_08015 [Verrucomicrobia bacterium]|nr:hypothetical protein [Verrucomicrobiota bacterium]